MSGIYVYAIIPAVNLKPFEVAGLSPADPRVGTIRRDGLAAVVGAAPLLDFHALPREDAVRYLLAHQRVVEAVMRAAPTLPVKFGTILPDEAAVVSLLTRGKAVLAPRLAELAAACSDRVDRVVEPGRGLARDRRGGRGRAAQGRGRRAAAGGDQRRANRVGENRQGVDRPQTRGLSKPHRGGAPTDRRRPGRERADG